MTMPPTMALFKRDEDEAEPDSGPELSMIGPLTDRRQAREWALVLQSQRIGYVLQLAPPQTLNDEGTVIRPGGWVLSVAPDAYGRAIEAIDLYEEENENWPPVEVRDTPRHAASFAVPTVFAMLALFHFYVTGASSNASAWFGAGRADAFRLLSEPWRMLTALTLHADAQHVLGNALSGSIFGAMVTRRIGPGGAILAILLSGVLGNAFNAIHHLDVGHWSIGASTAVFGAVGILASVQTVIDWGRRDRRRVKAVDIVAPIVGGLALLGALGAGGGNTDVWAHGYGFLAGVILGAGLGLWMRLRNKKPSAFVQGTAVVVAAALTGVAWVLAVVL